MRAIKTLKNQHDIKTLCRVLKVNRSTYYKHQSTGLSKRELENQALRGEILTIYSKSKKRMGAYKVRQRLQVEYSRKVSVGRVYRLMKSMSLPKMSTVKYKTPYTRGKDENLKNHLNKEFNPKAQNQVWASDITYVKVSGHFCYVCAIMDLFSRKILAVKASTNMDTKLVLDTFHLAYSRRGYPKGVMFHSGRGTQYTAKEFRKVLDNAGFVQSFSAKGHPYDNAVLEAFFRYLKHEELNRRTFNSLRELHFSLFEYIEGFYNRSRSHSANNWLSPDEMECVYFEMSLSFSLNCVYFIDYRPVLPCCFLCTHSIPSNLLLRLPWRSLGFFGDYCTWLVGDWVGRGL